MTTGGGVRVREARQGDAAALADLATQLGYPSTPAELAIRLERILKHPEHAVFVAEADGSLVRGFAHVSGEVILQSGERAELHGLVMDEAMRGRGIGRLLVAEAERWAAAHGYPTMCVRCNVVRAETHRFYEQLGYRCSKTQKHFRKTLEENGKAADA
jgi:GNAT superfamily N-acetyltransferase